MKTITSIALGAFMLASLAGTATIITVNNANPSPGQHSTIAAAIAAAATGDTLMVAGTGVNYGDATVNKSLTIIGPGRVVSGGGYSNAAQFNTINISEDNTRLIGIRAGLIYSTKAGIANVNNVVVMRSIIDNTINLNDDDWTAALIEGNVFSLWNDYNLSSNGSTSDFLNCTIRNNVFNGVINSAENSNITHNLFLSSLGGGTIFITTGNVINGTFQGNIAINRQINTVLASNNVSGNLSFGGSGAWTGGGNITNMNPLFVTYTANTSHAWTYDYHLQAGSPAIGAGPNSEDIGIYDGDGVFRMDGEPSIPIVRAVNVPGGAVVPANATFNVNIISVAHE